MKDVILLTGKLDNLATARLLIHFSVTQANMVGGPRGQTLEASGNAIRSAAGGVGNAITASSSTSSG